jgi:hypothetical protein
MKKTTIEQIEKRMDEISHEMAVHFNEHVTAANLSKWLTETGDLCVKRQSSRELKFSPLSFLHSIGWSLLPNLINCKNNKDRYLVIKQELLWLFECEGYINTKKALSEIGNIYLKSFEESNYEPMEIYELMNFYTTWLLLISMFSEYEFLKKQQEAQAA